MGRPGAFLKEKYLNFIHMFKESNILSAAATLPGLDCGACGFRTCELFRNHLVSNQGDLKLCIHLETRDAKPIDPAELCATVETLASPHNPGV